MTNPRRLRAALLLFVSVGAASARAAEDDGQAPIYAIQNRHFEMRHELQATVGVLPINAFTKGLTVGGAYTYHFSPVWSWEIAQFAYSFTVDTSLKQELLTNFQVQPTQIESLEMFGSSNIVLTPFYGKLAALNRHVMHLELFLEAGPAVGKYINPSVVRAGFDAGGGLRFFLSEYFSLRVDVRDYTFFKGTSPASELFIGLSVALTLGGSHK